LEESGGALPGDRLDGALTALNFNHLDFWCYKQDCLKFRADGLPVAEAIALLKGELRRLAPDNVTGNPVYAAGWPSLSRMTGTWLQEELAALDLLAEKERAVGSPGKLPLDLSVAQLACIVKLFHGDAMLSLKQVFDFIAAHFSTKKQAAISPGSLSKEYYSIDQKTAAVIRDKLSRMIARINRDYFPVMVAAGLSIRFYAGW
jgi:hypothetical protein